ncbi:unnamed protein product [Dovyalis caffra]|uniref:RRM domain-containing protein n=1 Tax=Dovyalis caffra TaxID=77055 RepID=A0AAV1RD21_9ROSI|nr:unnamed protein product [Dovyalis caffra]
MAKKRKSTSTSQKSSSSKQPKIEKPPPAPPSESEEEEEEEEEESDNQTNNSSPSETDSEDSGSEEEEEENSESESEEEESEDSKRETVNKLLQPFTKELLIKILKEAASTNPSVATEIFNTVDSDPVHRKIFIHGLAWDANNETIISVFKQYGEIEECKVVTDKTTGRAKGYGFILFKTRIAARKALKEPQKKVGNRTVSCQLASIGNGQNQKQDNSDISVRKLFIRNVGPQISVENLRAFFAQFGEIEDGPSGFERNTGKFRGFAFIVYKSLEGIRKALEEPVKVFEGIKLHCSISSKNNSSSSSSNKATVVEAASAGAGGNAGVVQGNIGFQGLLNQGMVGQNVNPTGSVLLGQNPALGVLDPVLGLGFTTQHGVNTISSSMIGSYNSQAALQGLGAYQSSQLSQPSASAARSQAGIGYVPKKYDFDCNQWSKTEAITGFSCQQFVSDSSWLELEEECYFDHCVKWQTAFEDARMLDAK